MNHLPYDPEAATRRCAEMDRRAGADPIAWFTTACNSTGPGTILMANLARRRLVSLGWAVAYLRPPAWKRDSSHDPRRLFRQLVDARQRQDGEAIQNLLGALKKAGWAVILTEPKEGRQAHQ